MDCARFGVIYVKGICYLYSDSILDASNCDVSKSDGGGGSGSYILVILITITSW